MVTAKTMDDGGEGPVVFTLLDTTHCQDLREARVTTPFVDGSDAIIPQPPQRLPDLRQAVATVAPSRLGEFFDEMQRAFTECGERDSVIPIRMFYRKWAATVAIARRPEAARRLQEAERSVHDTDPEVRNQAIRTAGEIVRAAHEEAERV